ncbi:hypothetical protein C806_01256 [Lachnospiraceae bacterium 3-1]|nr:hypothetical protein C806_01256 [Lachnospiraceae bacterium 3-1]
MIFMETYKSQSATGLALFIPHYHHIHAVARLPVFSMDTVRNPTHFSSFNLQMLFYHTY